MTATSKRGARHGLAWLLCVVQYAGVQIGSDAAEWGVSDCLQPALQLQANKEERHFPC